MTLKLPAGLAAWIESESKRVNRPKSALVRDLLLESQRQKCRSALDLAGDLCGCVDSGLGDLSSNRIRLKGFGR